MRITNIFCKTYIPSSHLFAYHLQRYTFFHNKPKFIAGIIKNIKKGQALNLSFCSG